MATLSHAESRRLNSWRWGSHISPRNSKWLQENLADMDVKIKSMIKLIEEDADSFRKRAEMYYRKRPEFLKLVEEFYRAYRGLAERYDHATGALRQAHRTMAAAFPDQVPMMLPDESPAESHSADAEPRTPAALPHDNPLFDAKDARDDKNADVQLLLQENRNLRNRLARESERAREVESEMGSLRGTVSKLESENALSQEKISSLEAGISRIHLDLKKLDDGDDDRCRELQLELAVLEGTAKRQQRELDTNEQILQDEISLLEGSKRELENDVGVHGDELTEQIGVNGKISEHISEKAALISQIGAVACNMEELSEKNGVLESSLCDVNVELEGLRGKLIALEESCRSLHCQNSSLLAEKSSLVTQVENISQSVENLNRKYAELESKNSNMETEKDQIHHRARDLQQSLRAQKEEHETRTSRSHLESLEDQIRMLQERGRLKEEELEAEHHKIIHAQIEIFILQRILRDMKENNVLCLDNCQRYLVTCRRQEELISELKRESLRQQKMVKWLSQYNEKLAQGIHEVTRSLDISEECRSPDALHFDLLLLKIEGLKTSISDAQDDNQRLILDLTELQSEPLTLQSEKHRMLELNERLREDVQVGKDRERVLKAEMEILHRELSDLQEAYSASQSDIGKLIEEKMALEEGNSALVAATMKLEHLYLIFRSYCMERAHELQLVSYNVDRLLEECRRRVVILEDEVEMRRQTYQEKMQELLTKCESLEISCMIQKEMFDEEIARRDAYGYKTKERVDALDRENRGLKEELSAYLPLIFSLRGFVSSLEQHIFPLATHHIHRKQDRRQPLHQSMSNASAFGSFELQKLHTMVNALEEMVIGILSLLEHGKYVSKTASGRDSEGSKSKGAADLEEEEEEEASIGKDIILRLEKCNAEICDDESEQIVKDIRLDHVISPSWYEKGSIRNHGAKDQAMEDRVMELWETMDSNKMAKPSPVTSGRYLECHQTEVVEEEKSACPSSIGLIKNTASISERLTSDAQRLSALQTSAKQLKTTMEASELSDAPISFECKKVKAQLKVAEAAISRLIDTNNKLTEKADKLSSTSGSLVGEQKISERARKVSEKIGRLELELQKLEYIWLKLKEEHDYRRAKAADRRTRVLLRDYFYGRLESPRRKRVHCCACIRPRTKDE